MVFCQSSQGMTAEGNYLIRHIENRQISKNKFKEVKNQKKVWNINWDFYTNGMKNINQHRASQINTQKCFQGDNLSRKSDRYKKIPVCFYSKALCMESSNYLKQLQHSTFEHYFPPFFFPKYKMLLLYSRFFSVALLFMSFKQRS